MLSLPYRVTGMAALLFWSVTAVVAALSFRFPEFAPARLFALALGTVALLASLLALLGWARERGGRSGE